MRFSIFSDDTVENRTAQRVDLLRRNSDDTSGIYRCGIETNAVNDVNGRETVFVGLYANGGEKLIYW